jgi:chemotaxis protein methyltransferase CheR
LPQQSVERRPAVNDSSFCCQEPKILFDRALLLAKNRQPEQSLELLEKIIGLSPSFVNALLLKACLLLDGCCYEQAASACQSVNAIDPLRCESYLISGLIARQNSKEMDALEYFRKAIFLKQDCWVAHFYSAEILYSRKEYKLANAGYQKTVSLLKEGSLQNSGIFFPLSFDTGQFVTISKHKLSLLKEVR